MNAFMTAGVGEYSGAFYQGPVVHMLVVTHYVQKTAVDKLSAGQHDRKLNLAYEGYFALLAENDRSPGELAAGLGISKQACSKTIREMEVAGLIARRPNPEDSRSSLLSLTPVGQQRLRDGLEVIRGIYRQFALELGADKLEQLVAVLDRLRDHLGIELSGHRNLAPLTATGGDDPARLVLLLPGISNHLRQALATSLSAMGFAGLKPSFGQVLGLLRRGERRIQYIASVVGISKQAIAATAVDLERAGFISRQPDPQDRRQVILRLTGQGRRLLEESLASVRALEASIEEALGADEYRQMDETLAAMYLQVAGHFDTASVLPARIQKISEQLLEELGIGGLRSLTQHLMTMTRGEA